VAERALAILVGAAMLLSSCGRMSAPTPDAKPPDPAAATRPGSGAGTNTVQSIPPQDSASTAALNAKLLRRAANDGTPNDLPLGPGDLIEITVFEVPELSGLKVRVTRPGAIVLPLLGEVPVAGETPGQLETDLRQRLTRSYMYDPHVTVFVHERTSQRVSVIGAVRKGGVFELKGRLRLADALGQAEGLTDDADHVVYLFRGVPAGTAARAEAIAKVAGTSPAGAVPPKEPTTAKNPTSPKDATKGSEATEEVMTAINLDSIANGSEDLNVLLEAGDVIQVPRAGSIYVGGAVTRPGSLPLKSKTTVQQAIVAAGGVTNVAALSDVRLYRVRANGQTEVITLDLAEFESGKTSPEVEKNDVIIVGKSVIKGVFWGLYELFRGVGVGVGL
jgi:polysaccharide biosynthesis/export protein